MSRYVEIDQPWGYDGWGNLPADVQNDETVCADCGAPIGPVLGSDPETGHVTGGWVSLWRAPDGRLLCEDCTVDAEEAEKVSTSS